MQDVFLLGDSIFDNAPMYRKTLKCERNCKRSWETNTGSFSWHVMAMSWRTSGARWRVFVKCEQGLAHSLSAAAVTTY